MPRPHYREAPPELQRLLETVRTNYAALGRRTVSAAGLLGAMNVARVRGYAWPLEDVPTPALNELARLEREEPYNVARFRRERAPDLEFEQRCLEIASRD